jgi:pSer/pThr/pTyr-binding forkhead associated (FHA) protein
MPFALVGRSARADLMLDVSSISRRHAYLQMVAGRVFCLDLDSRTGIHWDGIRRRSGWLGRGQALGVGSLKIRLLGGDREGLAPPTRDHSPLVRCPSGQDLLPGVSLTTLKGSAEQVLWRMDRPLALVGRSRYCKVQVADPDVSRFHCSLLRTPSGLWLISLLDGEGVAVNGKPVPWALLAHGDRVQVGRLLLGVQYDSMRNPGAASAHPVDAGGSEQGAAAEDLHAPDRRGDAAGWEGIGRRQLVPCTPPPPSATGSGYPLLTAPSCPGGHPGQFPPGSPPATAGATPPMESIARQLVLMQREMWDQFMEALLILGRTLTRQQDEQFGIIREEFDRLRQLSQEIRSLQVELAEPTAQADPPVPRGPRVARTANGRSQGEASPQSEDRGGSRPAPPGGGGRAASPSGRNPQDSGPSAAPRNGEGLPRNTGQADEDFHAEVSQRLEALQRERHGRWRSLLHLLRGNPAADE